MDTSRASSTAKDAAIASRRPALPRLLIGFTLGRCPGGRLRRPGYIYVSHPRCWLCGLGGVAVKPVETWPLHAGAGDPCGAASWGTALVLLCYFLEPPGCLSGCEATSF